jgi:hypothetical protein
MSKSNIFCSALALYLFLGTLAAAEPDIQALIITGRDHHDWQSTTPYLRKLLTDTGRFAVRVEEEPAGIKRWWADTGIFRRPGQGTGGRRCSR